MKRFWNRSLLAIATVACLTSAANAQNNLSQAFDGPAARAANTPISLTSWGLSGVQDPVSTSATAGADAQGSLSDEVSNGQVASDAFAAGESCYEPAVAAKTSNWTVGARGLYFTRDSEDDVRLSRNAAGDVLLSTDANMNTMGGVEADLTKRNCDGNGLQFIYWGLYPGEAFDEILGPGLSSYRGGLTNIAVAPGAQNLLTFFDNADTNYAYRTNEVHNVEINLLRNAGAYTTRRGRDASFELIGGFRWFQFNETFGVGAFNAATNPTAVEYEIDVENTLLGFQLGGRSEYCLTDRLGASVGVKLGVFNNGIDHNQAIGDSNGVLAYRTASGTDDYDYSSYKNDLSMLGEFDFGMHYRLSCNSRVVCGYRLVGISGIALAPDQIPNDFTLDNEINAINSNGDLILGGGYAGLEFCF